MAANSKIKVDELNFAGIKANLKAFLKGQEQFKDYDFEGSNLAMIVDLLAYNTYYNAIYNNLAVNEIFLDSASKRESVVSISKMLGYIPKSTRSSRAVLEVTASFPNASTSRTQLVLPKYTVFNSTINDKDFYFMNLEERVAIKNSSGTFVFSNLEVTEGRVLTKKFVAAPTTKYILDNAAIDTSTIKVYVSDSTGTGDPVLFQQSVNVVSASATTNVYFINEIDNGYYELTFGDGQIGAKLNNGNLVTVEYVVSSGEESNQCKVFSADFSGFAPGARTQIVTTTAAIGGSAPESLSSVKFNAPRSFYSQNRAVTRDDYSNVLFENFANVNSVHVWGGEDNDPPVYGKVYICVRPKQTTFLSNEERGFIKTLFKQKGIMTTSVEILDPTYINILVNSTVYYNPNTTSYSADAIADFVRTTILNYNTSELLKFDAVFKHSKLSRLIDTTEKSIQSNVTTIKLRTEVTPKLNTNAQYIIRLGNPIYTEGVPERSVESSGFYKLNDPKKYFLRDDGLGKVVMYYIEGSSEVIVNANIGAVDYTNGIVTINSLNISAIDGSAFEFTFKPESYDVVALRNNVLNIPAELITVTAVVDSVQSRYQFTSSRS